MIKKLEKKISEIAVESLRLLNKYKLEEFVPIIIEKKKIGWIYKENLDHLISNSLLGEGEKQTSVKLNLQEAESFFQKSYIELRRQKLIRTDVHEQCPVFYTHSLQPRLNFNYSSKFCDNNLFNVQRSILGFFGLPAYGVHLNGWKLEGKNVYFLLGKRSKNIKKFPGLYDNLVAGGVVSNLSLNKNLAKESYEEASITEKRIKNAKLASVISYFHINNNCFSPSVIISYDLEINNNEKFKNLDGEVEGFDYFNTDQIFELAEKRKIKPNSMIPIIDFLVRKNFKVFSENALKQIKKFLM